MDTLIQKVNVPTLVSCNDTAAPAKHATVHNYLNNPMTESRSCIIPSINFVYYMSRSENHKYQVDKIQFFFILISK